MRPVFIPSYINDCWNEPGYSSKLVDTTRQLYKTLFSETPDISVVIPAYNEESSILKTLFSICNNKTSHSIEIIVVDNNSADRTASIVNDCGLICIPEPKQGITNARNAGLKKARGKYVLNADADSLYPVSWIEDMITPLEKFDNVAITYGKFSFIPTAGTPRPVLFLYEYLADFSRLINRRFKDEAVSVYGFNSGFRREEGIAVGGFDHPPGTNEDGWLALKLRDKGYGKLYQVKRSRALVWTTDRRIQIDGGILKGTIKRVKRMLPSFS